MARNKRTSAAVSKTPPYKGSFGNKRQRPMAEPRSSAKSVEIMAISDKTYKG